MSQAQAAQPSQPPGFFGRLWGGKVWVVGDFFLLLPAPSGVVEGKERASRCFPALIVLRQAPACLQAAVCQRRSQAAMEGVSALKYWQLSVFADIHCVRRRAGRCGWRGQEEAREGQAGGEEYHVL